ncbi:anibiotic ABC transporter [Burkholderia sp. Bp9090]|uniref:TolC family outer membrane protein n=1 Tax=Burkholderia sp. Bp9090 TaxID=2184567 RepID=UPI000F5EA662|nr:TolC family outer membrane protein [Burkholderia sp. Bp9090]RQZ35713.1 anibiotic ABC transporter [Burkholderia sp. Bp9090]
MISTRLFLLVAFLGWLDVTWPARAANLLDAVNAAQHFDASIGAARNARLSGREKRWQGLAGLLPRVELNGHYTKQDQPTVAYAAAVRRHSASAIVTQPLFDVSRFADFQRGGTQADQADIEYEKAWQTLINEVANASFDVLYGREVLQAAEAAQQAFHAQFDQSLAALRIGDGTRTDVDEARANLDEARARTVGAQTDLAVANGTLQRLTGLSDAELEPIAWSCAQQAASSDLVAAMDDAARDNVDVLIAGKQLDQSQADIVAAAGAHLPVVNLQASYGTNWSRGANENGLDTVFGTTSKTRSSMIGVTVTIPLFAGGGPLSASREAYRRRDQARDALEDARRKARERARAAYLGITNGLALIRARERALASAGSKVKSTRLGREVGLRTQIDELNAQQRYFEAIRDLADARYRYLRARLQLSAALGTLGDDDVAGIVCRGGDRAAASRTRPANAVERRL